MVDDEETQTNSGLAKIPGLDAGVQEGLFPVPLCDSAKGGSDVRGLRMEEIPQSAGEVGCLHDGSHVLREPRKTYRFNYRTGGWQRRM